jgi:integrase
MSKNALPVEELYRRYIHEMTTTWSPTSIKSELPRFNKLWAFIDGDASKLWEELKRQQYGRHTAVGMWTRITCFWDWAIENGFIEGVNPYKVFRKKNRRAFLNAYVRKPFDMTYSEAKARIMKIPAEDIRNTCLLLLSAGMRWSEQFTLTDDGWVVGKGSKARRVYHTPIQGMICTRSRYSSCLREMKKVGIPSPHKLRHIKMSSFVANGGNVFELTKLAGWSSVATAQSYVNARDEEIRRKTMMDEVEAVG